MSHYEVMGLFDLNQSERGAVFVNKETKRVLELDPFDDMEDAVAFAVWLEDVHGINVCNFPSMARRTGWLANRRDEWNHAKEQSALAALGEAIHG